MSDAKITPPEYLAGLAQGHADRDGEVSLLNAVIREHRDALRECAEDLAAELDARHCHRDRYPSIMRDWQRDMVPVERARALIASAKGH